MLMIRRYPDGTDKSSLKIYKDGEMLAAVRVVDVTEEGTMLGVIGTPEVTFLRGEVKYQDKREE